MRKAVRIAAIVAATLAVVAGGAFAGAMWLGERKLARTVDVRVVPVAFTRDLGAVRQGKALYESGCARCHGDDGGGRVVSDEPGGLYVRAPDITTHPGGAVEAYDEADWVRAVRHGVSPRARALRLMPSEAFNRWTDAELAAVVAYVRALPPREGLAAEVRLPALEKAMYGLGLVRDAAERIDHRLPPPPPAALAR